METGTCCWPAPAHICNYDAPSSHNCPRETKSFDLEILRGALHAEPKIKYWFTGFGNTGGGEVEGGGGGGCGVGAGLSHCFNKVSLVSPLSGCQSEMKAAIMRSWRTWRPSAQQHAHSIHSHTEVRLIWDSDVLNYIWIKCWISASETSVTHEKHISFF